MAEIVGFEIDKSGIKKRIRNALRPLRHFPWLNKKKISDAVYSLGVRKGGILFVHSSLSGLGYIPGGACCVIESLLETIGSNGTLIMPAHSWYAMEQGCRTFDVRHTPCCVGAICELFRSFPGVLRSRHPTHSVSVYGPLSQWLIEGHEFCLAPCGEGSPYTRVLEEDCQILFLGLGLQYNTAYHTVESLANVPYLLNSHPDRFELIDEFGRASSTTVYRHRPGALRDASVFENYLNTQQVVVSDKANESEIHLIAGLPFRQAMLRILEKDPLYFLTTQAKAQYHESTS
jgi:aminoglycoside 3-N-acetyltransferase